MKALTIYQDKSSGSTTVSNHFIDIYMKDANDAQIKIYLYLLRMMGAGQGTSIAEMADTFNHTEKDVLRALKYWEKNRLLRLDYDASRNIVGIQLKNPEPGAMSSPAREAAEIVPITPGVVRVPAAASCAQAPAEGAQPAVAAKEAEETNLYACPSYSADDLKAFKAHAETGQLLFIVEQYIGKPLSANEIRTVLFICDRLGFSMDLVDCLVQYCVGRGKKDFRYIEKVAISWAQENITTPKQAAAMMKKHDKSVYGVMNALGKSGAPTDKEMEYIDRWNKQFQFPADIIKEACDRTVLATDKHRFEYADGILSNWKQADVRQMGDIRALDERYLKSKSDKQTASGSAANRFNRFKQNDYDFDELEKELLSN